MSKEFYVHESSYIDPGVTIGKRTKIWHFCHIQWGTNIGNDCTLGQNVYTGENVRIGNGVKIQNNVSVYNGVVLEDFVFCGPSCVFTNDLNPRAKYPKGTANYQKTIVKTGASIGANATILCNHTIGRWALIGAGWVCECGKRLGDDLVCACGRVYEKYEKGLAEVKCNSGI